MQDTDQFARLLHIAAPWRVSSIEVDDPKLTVTIHVRLDDSARVQCPKCRLARPRYDARPRRWRHLDTMEYSTYVVCDVPRVSCPEHGVIQSEVSWADGSSRYTVAFECRAIDWLREASVSAVARNLKLSWTAIDGIKSRAVQRGLARRQQSFPQHLSVDETSFQRRHEYVTVVTDQSTGAVVYVADDRNRDSLAGYFRALPEAVIASIQSVSMDMWQPYIGVVQEFLPEAHSKICFDKFHVAQHLGDGVDRVRRAEHKQLMAEGDERLKGTRYRWLEQPANMRKRHIPSFRELRDSVLKTAAAWALKEHAMCLWHYVNRTWAAKAWAHWINWASKCNLEPMIKVAALVERHLWGIINAIVLKRNNAMAESANARIQRVKARACGFRNRERFRVSIMFHLGKLDLYPRAAQAR